MIHEEARREIMQRGEGWHCELTGQEAAFPGNGMTFSPNPTKFHKMIQSEGLSANIKVNGVLVFGYMRLSQRQV